QTATGAARRAAKIAAPAVTVLNPEIVSTWHGIRVFDLIDGTTETWDDHVMRRHGRVAVTVAEPDRIAKEKHDLVQTSAAHGRLMVVIAHCIVIRQEFGVHGIALLHVVEAHGGCSLAGGYFPRSIVGTEVCRLGLSIVVGADGHFGPG